MQSYMKRAKYFLWFLSFLLIGSLIYSALREMNTIGIIQFGIFDPLAFAVTLQQTIVSFGYISWLVFILLMALSTMTPFPDWLFTFTAGLIWGPAGVLLSLTGSLIGNIADFYIARVYGSEYVKKKFPKAYSTISQFIHKAGWESVLTLRLIPNPIPFDWIGYAAGISPMRFREYFFATLVGIAPAQLLTVLYASGIKDQSLTMIIYAVIFTLIFAGVLFALRSFKSAKKK